MVSSRRVSRTCEPDHPLLFPALLSQDSTYSGFHPKLSLPFLPAEVGRARGRRVCGGCAGCLWARERYAMSALRCFITSKKERKKTDNPREGWEDGTPPPHRDFKERSVVLAVAHPNPWSSASFYLPSQSLADSRCNLHATSRSSHSRRSLSCRFFLCRVALLCLVLRRRRCLPIPCPRLSAQLCPPRGISWPLEFIELSSRKDDSSDSHCDHLPPSHIVAQVHSRVGHLYLHR